MPATLTNYLQGRLAENLITPNTTPVTPTHISFGSGGVDSGGALRVPEPIRTTLFSEDSSGKIMLDTKRYDSELRQAYMEHTLGRSVANGVEISELGLWYHDGTVYHLLVHRTFTKKVKDDISDFIFITPLGFDTFNPEAQGIDIVSEFIKFTSNLGRYIKADTDVANAVFEWDVTGVSGFTTNSVRVFQGEIGETSLLTSQALSETGETITFDTALNLTVGASQKFSIDALLSDGTTRISAEYQIFAVAPFRSGRLTSTITNTQTNALALTASDEISFPYRFNFLTDITNNRFGFTVPATFTVENIKLVEVATSVNNEDADFDSATDLPLTDFNISTYETTTDGNIKFYLYDVDLTANGSGMKYVVEVS